MQQASNVVSRGAHARGSTAKTGLGLRLGRPVLVPPLDDTAACREGESHGVPREANVSVGVVDAATTTLVHRAAKRELVLLLLHIQGCHQVACIVRVVVHGHVGAIVALQAAAITVVVLLLRRVVVLHATPQGGVHVAKGVVHW